MTTKKHINADSIEPSRSPERHTFNATTPVMIELLKTAKEQKLQQEADPEWQKNNLEWALRTTDWILSKVRTDDTYAQRLYATLCNNDFIPPDVWKVLKDETWSCSWRYAGGIIADMREQGDYIDWYCSGNEGEIFPDVEQDLNQIGWRVVK